MRNIFKVTFYTITYFKRNIKRYEKIYFTTASVILIFFLLYGLWLLVGEWTGYPNITLSFDQALQGSGDQIGDDPVVASRRGNVYHAPWCPGALRISEKNKILFETSMAARAAGYRPAKNCPGLE